MKVENQNAKESSLKGYPKNIKMYLLYLLEMIEYILLLIIIYIIYQRISMFTKLFKSDLIFDYSDTDVLIFTNPRWSIPRTFLTNLKNIINQFPVNVKTGHPIIMLAATTGWPYIWYTLNYYCSLRLRVPSNYYLFIALDDESYFEMKKRGIPTIQYSHKAPKNDITTDTTVLRMAIAYQLLQWKVDVLLTDTDMVFF